MVLRRQFMFGGEGSSETQNKRRHLPPTLFKGVNKARDMQEFVTVLEPIIRKWVQEAVESSIQRILRNSHNQIDCPGSRTLRLRFEHDFPRTLFTGHRVLSDDRRPVKIFLYDSSTGKAITSGPLSSIKVSIVVLDADFCPDDQEDWTKKEFDDSIVQNREGKRPLVTGELIVALENGVGHIREVMFTDNSSWRRRGKFRLGAKANTYSDQIREGISNSFRVKDQRGESYQKHYPPLLDDEVWRLEKIAKDGASHKRLALRGVSSVRDFLRLYVSDQSSLRAMLPNISNRTWLTILEHAKTCTLDDTKYLYKTALGNGLFFNSIYEVIGVTDGQSCHSLDNLNLYQMRTVEDLKQHAYKNKKDLVRVSDALIVGYPMLLGNPVADNLNNPVQDNFLQEQDQLEMQLNTDHLPISPPYNCEVDHDTSSFELGESSHQMQGFVKTFRNSFEICYSPSGFYIGENHIGSHLSTNDIPVDDNFQVESSLWKGNGLFLDSTNHEIGTISSDYGTLIPTNRMPRTKWCKVLAVMKWRILVRRNVAARKWQRHYNDFLM